MGQAQSDLYRCGGGGGGGGGGGALPGNSNSGNSSNISEGCGSGVGVSEVCKKKKLNLKAPNNEHPVSGTNNQTTSTRFKRNLVAASRGGGGCGRRQRVTPGGDCRASMTPEQELHVRKLSNVSNRNIQLLSMKPRDENDNFAEGLRSRRRSSLISLILGAPSRGPRFSEDLCMGDSGGVGGLQLGSSGSHQGRHLFNFGIDFCPDTVYYPVDESSSTSISSSLARLDMDAGGSSVSGRHEVSSLEQRRQSATTTKDDGFVLVSRDCRIDDAPRTHHGHNQPDGSDARFHRRRSSLGSLTSFDPSLQQRHGSAHVGGLLTSERQNPVATSTASERTGSHDPTQGAKSPNSSGAKDSITTTGPWALDDIKSVRSGSTIHQLSPDHPRQSEGISHQQTGLARHKPSLASLFLSSIDLTSSLDDDHVDERARGAARDASLNHNTSSTKHCGFLSDSLSAAEQIRPRCDGDLRADSRLAKLNTTEQTNGVEQPLAEGLTADRKHDYRAASYEVAKGRINHGARRMINRSGSELSLYSTTTVSSLSHNYHQSNSHYQQHRQGSRGSIGSVMLEASNMGASWSASTSSSRYPTKKSSHPLVRRILAENNGNDDQQQQKLPRGNSSVKPAHLRETKLIILLQVCLPFILAGFGNMGAGLVLNRISRWDAFQRVPIFFVLLPSFVGLKGNIEMTLASRLSTLSNLNLLDTAQQCRQAFVTNLILILSQAIGLSLFAAIASVLCEISLGKLDSMALGEIIQLSSLVVLPCALLSSVVLVCVSSLVVWFAIWLAKQIQVNPDNLSTLLAALYGDVSCVLTYGLFAQSMYSFNQQSALLWPVTIILLAIISWPLLWLTAHRSKETHELSVSSMPPMLAAIMVSLGSGAVLSLVVGKFSRIALYQPVVNGFGANLIAVQASRVSTWLWCSALRKLSNVSLGAKAPMKVPSKIIEFEFESTVKSVVPYGSITSLEANNSLTAGQDETTQNHQQLASLLTKLKRPFKSILGFLVLLLWSFRNASPNAKAARMLLLMIIPAHSLYFVVIWLLAPDGYVNLTWSFYAVYVALCLTQVFILLSICQPLMTLLMRRHLDPDIFGISLLMAMADLVGTLCLTGAFYLLGSLGDPNATLS